MHKRRARLGLLRRSTLVIAIVTSGCMTDISRESDKGEEADVDFDTDPEGKADLFSRSVDHGYLYKIETRNSPAYEADPHVFEISSSERVHFYELRTPSGGVLCLEAIGTDQHGQEMDTVIYLQSAGQDYDVTSNAIAIWKTIERADDTDTGVSAAMTAVLDPGRYRVVVKAYDRNTSGMVNLFVETAYPAQVSSHFPNTFWGNLGIGVPGTASIH